MRLLGPFRMPLALLTEQLRSVKGRGRRSELPASDPNADGTIYMRLYLITHEQFLEVQGQEGRWYSKCVELGVAEDGNPIYSFTSPIRYRSNPPSKKYRD